MERRILVTGPYGFLGKYVIAELVGHGYQVVAFGRKREQMEALRRPLHGVGAPSGLH